jgi:hypothetical protein
MESTKKKFYSRYPGSTFQVMRGPGICDTLSFNKMGEHETDDPAVIAFLEGTADKPGSSVYTKELVIPAGESTPAKEVIEISKHAIDKGAVSGATEK